MCLQTKQKLSNATAHAAAAEDTAAVASKELKVAIEVEQQATTLLQTNIVKMQTQSSQMEALEEDNEDLSAQNTAYRNRIRAMPSSAFSFENGQYST